MSLVGDLGSVLAAEGEGGLLKEEGEERKARRVRKWC